MDLGFEDFLGPTALSHNQCEADATRPATGISRYGAISVSDFAFLFSAARIAAIAPPIERPTIETEACVEHICSYEVLAHASHSLRRELMKA